MSDFFFKNIKNSEALEEAEVRSCLSCSQWYQVKNEERRRRHRQSQLPGLEPKGGSVRRTSCSLPPSVGNWPYRPQKEAMSCNPHLQEQTESSI